MGNQPGGGAVEQGAGPVRAGPAQGVEPAVEPELNEGFREGAVAVAVPDLGRVPAAPLGGRVLRQQPGGLDAELAGHERDSLVRHVCGLLQEGAQEPDGPELDGKAQPHVRAAAAGHEGAVGVVEVEVAGQLLGSGFAGIPTVAPLLLLVQEGDGHRRSLLSGLASASQVKQGWPRPWRVRGRGWRDAP